MPSTFKKPAHVPMWRGAKVAYIFIAMCLFPVAIGGYWAYGNLVSLSLFPCNDLIRNFNRSVIVFLTIKICK